MSTLRTPTLHLDAYSLCSKWGFNDGDCPDHLLDYWDEIGVDHEAIDWHDALSKLVRAHLLPELAANGHVIEVYDIETIHNPIRASTIDGHEVDDYAGRSGSPVRLAPESVEVPYAAIAEACGLGEQGKALGVDHTAARGWVLDAGPMPAAEADEA